LKLGQVQLLQMWLRGQLLAQDRAQLARLFKAVTLHKVL
jgi:hypothetical protein